MEEAKVRFERLYDTHVDAVFGYLAWRLSDRERAKELTNEVFMRLWSHITDGGVIEYEKAFLFTIAKRLFINEIRTPSEIWSLDALEEDSAFAPSASDPTPDTLSEYAELWRMIEALPPPVVELMRLRYQDGLSVQEIAALYEIAPNTVSMRINRALTQLQQQYQPPTP